MPWLFPALGIASLVIAGLLVRSVTEVKLGPLASKFVALVVGLISYFGIAGASAISFEPTKSLIVTVLIPVLGLVLLAVLAVKIWQNRDDEFEKIVGSGLRIGFIALFAILARVFLSQ